jgi:predicted GTPase
MGAGGRDFHDFNVLFRDDPSVEVVAFTAAQIPGIDDRVYPPALAGRWYPEGIAIHPERDLETLIAAESVDEVVLAYSDLSHVEVMHKASRALAGGADFRLVGPRSSMLESRKPVVAVCAARTGSGKSQTTRAVGGIIGATGRRVALIRHPMPYGALEAMAVQRFASIADIDAARPTIEEREEYEAPVAAGMVMFSGVDYERILAAAESEADVVVWDGGNNDFPFVKPDVLITVVDPLRPGDELAYHPGETNVRMADIVVVNKVDSAGPGAVSTVVANVRSVNSRATVVLTASPVSLAPGPSLAGAPVVVIEDGPTVTHGGMPFGAGTVAAREAGAVIVDPRPYAVGSLADTYRAYPGIGAVLPAMGYSPAQLEDLRRTVDACPCDVIVSGTPADLSRILVLPRPVRRATYALAPAGAPTLADALAPFLSALPGP